MSKLKINLRKFIFWILASAFIIVLIFIVRQYIITRGYESAAGIYITTGGQSFLEIKPGKFGALEVKDGLFYTNYWFLQPFFSAKLAGEGPVSLKASYRNGRLELNQYLLKKGIYGAEKEFYGETLNLILIPSKTIPGDWDLLDAKLYVFGGWVNKISSGEFWRELLKCRRISKAMKYARDVLIDEEWMYCYLEPSNAPVKSFLHCIDDDRIPFLYHSLFQVDYTTGTLVLARNISGKFPGDPYLDLVLADMESLSNHADRSLRIYQECMERFGSGSDPLFELARGIVWRNVSNAQWSKKSGRSGTYYNDIVSRDKKLEEKTAMIRDLFQVSDYPYYPLSHPLVPPFGKDYNIDYRSPDTPGLLIHARLSNWLSLFYLFQGRFRDSLNILVSSFSVGQSLYSNGDIISRLTGFMVCSITSSGLEHFILNACETPEDLQRTWIELEKLNNSPLRSGSNNILEGEHPILLCMMNISGKFAHDSKHVFRKNLLTMKFQLLRMAAAARHHLLGSGNYPASPGDFAPFLPGGLPEDAFADGKPLRFKQISDDELRIYSIGPDEKDDYATFAYDPTNGDMSSGDVYIQIPREREFPFPREGVRASNAYELLKQFPNGLPEDPFNNFYQRYTPLSIIESSQDQPLVIFSFGPDTDEADFTSYTLSSSMEKAFELVPTPEPPPNASYGRSLQWVMRRSEEIPPPPGYWTLEPMYDPTNGTVSEGDIFIEIPR